MEFTCCSCRIPCHNPRYFPACSIREIKNSSPYANKPKLTLWTAYMPTASGIDFIIVFMLSAPQARACDLGANTFKFWRIPRTRVSAVKDVKLHGIKNSCGSKLDCTTFFRVSLARCIQSLPPHRKNHGIAQHACSQALLVQNSTSPFVL